MEACLHDAGLSCSARPDVAVPAGTGKLARRRMLFEAAAAAATGRADGDGRDGGVRAGPAGVGGGRGDG